MPFGNSKPVLSRRDCVRIARRFNAWTATKCAQVPKGQLKRSILKRISVVPSGLESLVIRFPALKRRAILAQSLRDHLRRGPELPKCIRVKSVSTKRCSFGERFLRNRISLIAPMNHCVGRAALLRRQHRGFAKAAQQRRPTFRFMGRG